MKNIKQEIIYIGKAKNLKNRVSSYFISDSGHSDKVKKMLENISSFEYIITDSEFEALVLECSLIKKYKPKYNILLKDDKGYSYIKITNGKWPRVSYEKQKKDDDAVYIGPYTNSWAVKKTVEEICKIFKLPTCSKNLEKREKHPCLNYYIKRCLAPCIRAVSHENYIKLIKEVLFFLKKGSTEMIAVFKEKMNKESENMNFEAAAQIRDKIKAIESIKNKQKVVSAKVKEQDVIAGVSNEKNISMEVFRFQEGNLYESQNFILDSPENSVSFRTEFLKRYYTIKNNVPSKIFIDGEIENKKLIEKYLSEKSQKAVTVQIPKKGEALQLMDLCKKNAYENLLNECEIKEKSQMYLEDLKNVLNLKKTPQYIEAYDISNLYGKDNVGGMVVFKNGKPFKPGYRRFKISDIYNPDDYGSIREVLRRRLKNYIDSENEPETGFGKLPDLIFIDGGKAHTAAAKEIISEFNKEIPVFGMVKDRKHRTKALTTETLEIEIKNNGRLFSFITQIQDEVHRYAINYHKKLRGKNVKNSDLTEIPSIGKTRAKILLKTFGSIKRISKASQEELNLIDGITFLCAQEIYKYFHKN